MLFFKREALIEGTTTRGRGGGGLSSTSREAANGKWPVEAVPWLHLSAITKGGGLKSVIACQ